MSLTPAEKRARKLADKRAAINAKKLAKIDAANLAAITAEKRALINAEAGADHVSASTPPDLVAELYADLFGTSVVTEEAADFTLAGMIAAIHTNTLTGVEQMALARRLARDDVMPRALAVERALRAGAKRHNSRGSIDKVTGQLKNVGAYRLAADCCGCGPSAARDAHRLVFDNPGDIVPGAGAGADAPTVDQANNRRAILG